MGMGNRCKCIGFWDLICGMIGEGGIRTRKWGDGTNRNVIDRGNKTKGKGNGEEGTTGNERDRDVQLRSKERSKLFEKVTFIHIL